MTADSAVADVGPQSADVVEHEDGTYEVIPPFLRVEGRVPDAIVDAVQAAVEAEPNTLDAPKLWSPEKAPRGGENAVAVLTARYNEIPHTEDGELVGWLPPYRAREDFDAALADHLDGVYGEAYDGGTTGFYPEP